MVKFDGFLICTDFDGTFASGGQPVEENLEAVRYFTENGGRFTVATGRLVKFIRERGLQNIINAPACLCNGSLIYDYATETVLRQLRMDITARDVLEALREKADRIRTLYLAPSYDQATVGYEDLDAISDVHLQMRHLKVCCRLETPEEAEAVRDFALACPELASCNICRSSRTLLEFNARNATKGHALDHIRSYLGNIHTAIGVGDYENDLVMLRHADIAATPASGLELLKLEADLILKPCKEGAIKDLIERL